MQRYNPANPLLPGSFWNFPSGGYVTSPVPPPTAPMTKPGSPGEARIGDFADRRYTFGNVYHQPVLPFVAPNLSHWGPSQVYQNSFAQPFVQDGIPWGPYYAPPAVPSAMAPYPPYQYSTSIQSAMSK